MDTCCYCQKLAENGVVCRDHKVSYKREKQPGEYRRWTLQEMQEKLTEWSHEHSQTPLLDMIQ